MIQLQHLFLLPSRLLALFVICTATLFPLKNTFAKDVPVATDPTAFIFQKLKTNHNLFSLLATTANKNDQQFLNSLIQKTAKQPLPKVQLNGDKLIIEGLLHPIEMLTQKDGTVIYQYDGKKWIPDLQQSFARNIIVMGKTFFYQPKTTAQTPTSLFMNFAYAKEKQYFFAEKMDPETNKLWNELDEESKKQSEMLIDFQNKAGRLMAGAAIIGGGLLISRIPSPWTKGVGYGGAAVGLFMFTTAAKADEAPVVREFRCNGKNGPLEILGEKNNGDKVLLRILFDKKTKEPTTFVALDNGHEIDRQYLKVANGKWVMHSPIVKEQETMRDQNSALAMFQGVQEKCVSDPEQMTELNKKIVKYTSSSFTATPQQDVKSTKSK